MSELRVRSSNWLQQLVTRYSWTSVYLLLTLMLFLVLVVLPL